MENVFNGSDLNQKTIFDHPSGLFVLFFTEMWERFSYYGMRAILVLFLTSSILNEGWGWDREKAMVLYAIYTSAVYFTPIIGGYIADKYTGYRNAVVLGALTMALGHASLAFESLTNIFFYAGLLLLVVGNGLFKPNISSIVGQLYKGDDVRKDGGYTIFYMGINCGAFLGILLCGYLGEKIGWHYGFGLAGIFMFFGMLQFYFAQKIFGKIGSKPIMQNHLDLKKTNVVVKKEPNFIKNPFKFSGRLGRSEFALSYFIFQLIGLIVFLIYFGSLSGDDSIINTTSLISIFLSTISLLITIIILILNFLQFFAQSARRCHDLGYSGWYQFIPFFVFLLLFKKGQINENKYGKIVKNVESERIFVIIIFSIATIFFWWAFEQAGGAMTIFANDYTGRTLLGLSAVIFKVVNTVITIVPMIVITYVLLRLFKNIFNEYALSNIFLSLSFVIIWIIVFFMLGFLGSKTFVPNILVIGLGLDRADISSFIQFWTENYVPFDIFNAGVAETEIPASWFSVLNSLFIILLAPVFSLVWASKLNPSGPIKFSIGLILLGLGFGFLFYGSLSIPLGAETAAVSVIWLIIAYFFHTLGELCVSPVGLSYVSKLAPARLIGLMFGFWLLSSAVANFLGGVTGSYIDLINDYFGIAGFFLLFAIIPIGAGIVMFLINKILVKKMHGIK